MCDLLGRHPDVFMSKPKEIHYFGRDNAERPIAWYEGHFESEVVGEGSTSYTHPTMVEPRATAPSRTVAEGLRSHRNHGARGGRRR